MPGARPHYDLNFTLHKVFQKSNFRPVQRDIIEAALSNHDVFVQAATSFGKSLCFQLPAVVVEHGITIVISPLVALMSNQVEALRTLGIRAATLNSLIPDSERMEIMEDLKTGHPRIRLLYVTPEKCATESFRRRLQTVYAQRELSRIAIDEAHCISEWGHSFRPEYMELRWFRKTFPDVPMMCLTATATQRTRNDIITSLGLNQANMRTFTMTTSRPNIHYEIRFKNDESDHYADFLAWLRSVHARRQSPARAAQLSDPKTALTRLDNVSGIIYFQDRAGCVDLAARLSADGIGAKPYHADLPAADKEATLAGWASNAPGHDVIVATAAFGMGIDKGDVRFVCHWRLPSSFEAFYQEAGRAGRDGRAALCLLYYSREDRDAVGARLGRELQRKAIAVGCWTKQMEARLGSLKQLVAFCEDTDACRHALICAYFGEQRRPEQAGTLCDRACDVCWDRAAVKKRKSKGLTSEEVCATQREGGGRNGGYDEYDYDI